MNKTKKKPVKIKSVRGWAICVLETVGRNSGTYFISGVDEYRSNIKIAQKTISGRHPDWKLKIIPVLITPIKK